MPQPIALIGIGCRFPGGVHGPDALWELVQKGTDAITEVPPSRWDADAWFDPDPDAPGKMVTRSGGFLDDVDAFDAKRFRIAPKEARQMDPQQRLLLETTWEALEDGQTDPTGLEGQRVGVYVGMGLSDYGRRTLLQPSATELDAYAGTGTFTSVAAGRIAYALGLRGPALAVHTACSSSLVAVHLAIQALRSGQIDLAVAGGVNLLLSPQPSVYFSKLGALSPEGRCHTFSDRANGYGRGEGCGMVVLCREDAVGPRPVRAWVRGSAVNQDGRSNGLTAPSGAAQQQVIEAALGDAGLTSRDITLIEAHGTGTPLGDPIEVAALAQVYGPGEHRCAIGSVKANIGHTEAAAGIAGLIKATLALQHATVPHHRLASPLNPRIQLGDTRLHIPADNAEWVGPRNAGVSSFGLGGTNAHVILGAADPRAPVEPRDGPSLLLVSASSAAGLDRVATATGILLRDHPLCEVSRAIAHGRALESHRLAIAAPNAEVAAAALLAQEGFRGVAERPPKVVFAFTGQGAQSHRMARELYATQPVFREAFDAVAERMQEHLPDSLVEVIFGDEPDSVHHTAWTQPALFAVEWALTRLWASWGVEPDAVLGHSVGEVVAATVAGVFSLDDAVRLIVHRGRVMGELPEGGAMLAVRADPDAVRDLTNDTTLALAAVNAPQSLVLSGTRAAIDAADAHLQAQGIETQPLSVSHAFHSPLVEPVVEAFEAFVTGLQRHPPTLPLYSNLTGRLAGPEIQTATYWAQHIRRPVRFMQGLRAASDDGHQVFVEVGPRPVLTSLGLRTLPDSTWLPSLGHREDDTTSMLDSLGALYVRGHAADRTAIWAPPRGPVPLPHAPMERERHWIDPADASAASTTESLRRSWVRVSPAENTTERRRWVVGDATLAKALGAQTGWPEAPGALDEVVVVVRPSDDAPWATGPEVVRQAAARLAGTSARLSLVTQHGTEAGGTPVEPAAAMVVALSHTLSLESPNGFGVLVDRDANSAPLAVADALIASEPLLAVRDDIAYSPRLERVHSPSQEALPTEGAWLITGGLGALGLATAQWAVHNGVRHLVLTSRTGAHTPDRAAAVDTLRAAGAEVTVADIAVQDAAAMRSLVADHEPPIAVAIHAAGVAVPGHLAEQAPDAFAAHADAKLAGTEALLAALADRPEVPTVLFSSISATWGAPGLGGYAAANAWMDAAAQRASNDGRSILSIAWGPWDVPGMVQADDRSRFARQGLRPLSAPRALESLGALLGLAGSRVVVDADWDTLGTALQATRSRPLLDRLTTAPGPRTLDRTATSDPLAGLSATERERRIRDTVTSELRAVLGLAPGTPIDPHVGLFDLGMDSLMAVGLQRRLNQRLGLHLPATVVFDHPSITALCEHLVGHRAAASPASPASSAVNTAHEDIAIVGWSCRFPGAADPSAFAELLQSTRSPVGPLPARAGSGYGAALTDPLQFDPGAFGIGPDEATAMDPQQRLLLEVAVEALQHAGSAPERVAGSATGVFVGLGHSGWWDRVRAAKGQPEGDRIWPWSGTGNALSFAAGRIAYHLNLKGPAVGLDTACSSSLVAVHQAVRALRSGECDRALAGGANVLLQPDDTGWLEQIGALSSRGRCATFSAEADGYVRSEGCGVVVLRRLSDAQANGEPIVAVIKGSATGHGGAAAGITVPTGPAQAAVIRAALADANLSPEDVGTVECHGTGTPLGDPIEVGALREVFADREQPLVLGALKTQLGHAEAAAGIAGLLKAIVALNRSEWPSDHRDGAINPALDLAWPVTLANEAQQLAQGCIGISSFGISGTNAHVIVDAAPEAPSPPSTGERAHLFLASAGTESLLTAHVRQLATCDAAPPDRAAATLARGRRSLPWRTAAVGNRLSSLNDAGPAVNCDGTGPVRVAWVFSGQGAQHTGMGLQLDAELPAFATEVDAVNAALAPHLGRSVRELWAEPQIDQTQWAQPALFALGVALGRTLLKMGARPDVLLGHSIGEWTAAAVAGLLPLETCAEAVVGRGQAFAQGPDGGRMVGVRGSLEAIQAVLADHPRVSLAGVNGPENAVISGAAEAVHEAEAQLSSAGLTLKPLQVSHAFHSHDLSPAIADWSLPALPRQDGDWTVLSTLDGEPLGDRAADPLHWKAQAQQAVRFDRAVSAAGAEVFIELGPRAGLATLAAAQAPDAQPIALQDPKAEGRATFLGAVGQLWCLGVELDPARVIPTAPVAALPLPGWNHRRYGLTDEAIQRAPLFRVQAEAVRPDGAVRPSHRIDVPDASDVPSAIAAIRHVLDAAAARSDHRPILVSRTALSHRLAVGLRASLAVEFPDRAWQAVHLDPGAPDEAWGLASGSAEPVLHISDTWTAERWVPTESSPSTPRGTWVVTGASGALGAAISAWLEQQGCAVRRVSRSGSSDDPTWVSADVRTEAGVRHALAGLDALTGVIHCAGIQVSKWAGELTPDDLAAALQAKLGGALLLQQCLPDEAALVLFGSATANLGLPGQTAYGAANSALAALVEQRERTACIAWGPWQLGMAEGLDWSEHGTRPLQTDAALQSLAVVLAHPTGHWAIGDWDRERLTRVRGPLGVFQTDPSPEPEHALAQLSVAARAATLEGWVRDALTELLGHPTDAAAGFFEVGLDSLGAVELIRRLGQRLNLRLPPTLAFDHGDPSALARALADRLTPPAKTAAPAVAAAADGPIAVIGLAARFPGAPDAAALWALLERGGHAITEVPPERWSLADWHSDEAGRTDRMYARHGAFLPDIDQFDPDLFGLSPREAQILDPQQRLLLTTAWRAADDARILDGLQGSRTSVYVGIAERGWLRRFSDAHQPRYPNAWAGTGSESSFAAGRVAHALGLRGAAVALNTTCSSSLVAMHLAAEALRRGECDQALAGGVHLMHDPEDSVYLCQLGALSPTGRCHTFDAKADGYVRGEGCGIVVLKRLEDALRDGDPIRAVLEGSATNHDGRASGLTVPNGTAQSEVIQSALDRAGLQPADVGWLQAHGTGTPLGDPIELEAAARVFGRNGQLAVGTVKTALGHCELAAGAAGAIAAILALEHDCIPPHPIETVNPELDLTGFELPDRPTPFADRPRRVGVSAFGLSGTNAHLVFAAAPQRDAAKPASPWPALRPFAAHSRDALKALDRVAPAGTLVHRAHLPWRSVQIGDAQPSKPQRAGRSPVLAFAFTGQGSQWGGMHRALMEHPVYRSAFEEALAAVEQHRDTPLAPLLDDDDALRQTENTQPALFCLGWATAALWRSVGAQPSAVIGHSVGEITAATVAGAIGLADGAALIVARGRLMATLPPIGATAAVKAAEDVVRPYVTGEVDIAGVSHPQETTLAGRAEDVDAILTRLTEAGIEHVRLRVSHAFHSRLLEPILDEWEAVAAGLDWRTPDVPLISGCTGQALTTELADPTYWRRQTREAVRFVEAVRTVERLGITGLIECGPHPILLGMAQRTLPETAPGPWLPSLRRGDTDPQTFLDSVGRWWVHGGEARLDALHPRQGTAPPYPLQERSLWPDNDRFRRSRATYRCAWHPAEPAPMPDHTWSVLGEVAGSDALASSEAPTAVLDARPLTGGPLETWIAQATETLRDAVANEQAVWWLLPESGPDSVGMQAWCRTAFAEHPSLRGGWMAGGDLHTLLDFGGQPEIRVMAGTPHRPRIEPWQPPSAPEIGGRWVLVGGLGSLGQRTARWLAERGATSLVLTTRRSDPELPTELNQLREQGIEVQIITVDPTDDAALEDHLPGEVHGVVLLAGTTHPERIADAQATHTQQVLSAKLDSVRALDRWTRAHPVQHFVAFGSIAGSWGSAELAAYGAANAYLSGVCAQRRAERLPGVCVAWGPWGGGGMVDDARATRLQRMGQHLLDPAEALTVLGQSLASAEPEVIAARVDWTRFLQLAEAGGQWDRFDAYRTRPVAPGPAEPNTPDDAPVAWTTDALEARIGQRVRDVMRLGADATIERSQALMERGFDSLMATELRNVLLTDGIDVPLGRLLGGPSIEDMVVMAEARLDVAGERPSDAPSDPADDDPGLLLWTHLATFIVGLAVASAVWWAWFNLR